MTTNSAKPTARGAAFACARSRRVWGVRMLMFLGLLRVRDKRSCRGRKTFVYNGGQGVQGHPGGYPLQLDLPSRHQLLAAPGQKGASGLGDEYLISSIPRKSFCASRNI